MQAPNAPTPGRTTPGAAAIRSGSRVTSAACPTRSSAFCTDRRFPIP